MSEKSKNLRINMSYINPQKIMESLIMININLFKQQEISPKFINIEQMNL